MGLGKMNRRRDDVLITGIGLLSPFGNTFELFWEGLKYRKKAERQIKHFDALRVRNLPGIEVQYPSDRYEPEERILHMGTAAVRAALEDWGGSLVDYGKVGLLVGSGLGLSDQMFFRDTKGEEEGYLASLADKIALRVGIDCETIYIGNACCAGSQAVSYGMDLLDTGSFDIIIAGGIDIISQAAYGGFLRLNSIDMKGCKPFDRDRKGIMVGEGTVFFILEKSSGMKRKNCKTYCSLVGYGITSDAFHVVQMRQDGMEIQRAMEQALEAAGLDKGDINLVIAHGTGTPLNDRVESQVISRFFGCHLPFINVTSVKGALGHTGGASGAFNVLTAVGAITKGIIPPTANLVNVDPQCSLPLVYGDYKPSGIRAVMVNSFAFGGTNITLVCSKWHGEDTV